MQRNDCVVTALGPVERWKYGVVNADGTDPLFKVLAGVSSAGVDLATQYRVRVKSSGTNGGVLRLYIGDASVDISADGINEVSINTGASTRLQVIQQEVGATGVLVISVKRDSPVEYNELLHQYFLDGGATSGDLQDAEYQFLVAKGATPSSIPDMWFQLLETLGYSGTLSDMLAKFWCVDSGIIP